MSSRQEQKLVRHGRGTLGSRTLTMIFVTCWVAAAFGDGPCDSDAQRIRQLAFDLGAPIERPCGQDRYRVEKSAEGFRVQYYCGNAFSTSTIAQVMADADENLSIQPVRDRSGSSLFVQSLHGAAGRLSCSYVLYRMGDRTQFREMSFALIQDVDGDQLDEFVVTERVSWGMDCDLCMACIPVEQSVRRFHRPTGTLMRVAGDFRLFYKSALQQYERQVPEPRQLNPACQGKFRDLIRWTRIKSRMPPLPVSSGAGIPREHSAPEFLTLGSRQPDKPAGDALPVDTAPLIYEAEQATLGGSAKKNNEHDGFSGSGYVDGYGYQGPGSTTAFGVLTKRSGRYTLRLRYANATGRTMTLSIYLNGSRVRQTALKSMSRWTDWGEKDEELFLGEGYNWVTYKYDQSDTGNVNLDYLSVFPSGG